MKILPNTIAENDTCYELIKRNDFVAIYKQRGFNSYEVIIPDSTYKKGECIEIYPTSEQWGRRGWTYQTLDKAEERYNKVIQWQNDHGDLEKFLQDRNEFMIKNFAKGSYARYALLHSHFN